MNPISRAFILVFLLVQSLVIAQTSKDSLFTALDAATTPAEQIKIRTQIAELYLKENDANKGLYHVFQALDVLPENDFQSEFKLRVLAIDLYEQKSYKTRAFEQIELLVNKASELKKEAILIELYPKAIDLAENTNHYKAASDMKSAWFALKSEIDSRELLANVAAMKAELDSVKIASASQVESAETAREESENDSTWAYTQLYSISAVLGLIILGLVVLLVLKFISSKAKVNGLNKEITELKEKTDNLNSELGKIKTVRNRLIEIISKDLKEPLEQFEGLARIIESSQQMDDFARKEIVKQYNSKLINLNVVLNNIYLWSLEQTEGIPVAQEQMNLNQILADLLNVFKHAATAKGLSINVDFPAQYVVKADPIGIRVAIRNLLSNAVKYSDKGAINISATDEGGFIKLKISDNGIGMDPMKQRTIFEISNDKITRGTNGEYSTGVGLSLSKKIVDLNRGKIWVESEYQKGSTFYLTIQKAV